jgi:hypothetical protein
VNVNKTIRSRRGLEVNNFYFYPLQNRPLGTVLAAKISC